MEITGLAWPVGGFLPKTTRLTLLCEHIFTHNNNFGDATNASMYCIAMYSAH